MRTKQEQLAGEIVRVSEGSGPGSNKLFTVCSHKEKREYMHHLEWVARDYYTLDLIRESGWIVVKDDNGRFDSFPASRLKVE